MSYIFGKLWHLAIIWANRKAFQCILQGVRFLLAKQTRLSPTSNNESYWYGWSLDESWFPGHKISLSMLWSIYVPSVCLYIHQWLPTKAQQLPMAETTITVTVGYRVPAQSVSPTHLLLKVRRRTCLAPALPA